MRRVVNRVVFGAEPAAEQGVLAAAAALVPPERGWDWNQALIEFGALHCTARRPACIVCPLQDECAAFPVMQTVLGAKRTQTRPAKLEPFETTSRFFRGRIVDVLRALPAHDSAGVDLSQLGPQVRDGFTPEDVPWLRSLVKGLERDGLAVISEESPQYDSNPSSGETGTRVRLP